MMDPGQLPMSSKLAVYYTSCKASEDFSQKIIELLKGIIRPSKKEEIVIAIYRSIHCWLKTVTTLNNTIHVQALAAAARSIFEQLLDLKLIVDDQIDNAIEKFEAFKEIEKLRRAKRFLNFSKKHPEVKTRPHGRMIEYASDKNVEERVAHLRKLWSDSSGVLPHWSGLNIEQRAREAGVSYEIFYNESFILLSWYIHAGQVGTRGMTKVGLELVYGESMRLIHEMFIDVVLLTAKALKLDKGIEGFKDLVQELGMIPGFAILEEEKKYFNKLKKASS